MSTPIPIPDLNLDVTQETKSTAQVGAVSVGGLDMSTAAPNKMNWALIAAMVCMVLVVLIVVLGGR
ncbi:MAG: hypothetical protein ACPGMR_11490 [Pontibacterium sp.]